MIENRRFESHCLWWCFAVGIGSLGVATGGDLLDAADRNIELFGSLLVRYAGGIGG